LVKGKNEIERPFGPKGNWGEDLSTVLNQSDRVGGGEKKNFLIQKSSMWGGGYLK